MDTTNNEVVKTSSPSSSRLHPLMAGAAVAVILASLIGVAAVTGLLPSSNSANAPQQPLQQQQLSQEAPAPAPQAQRQQLAANSAPARVVEEQPARAAAPAICSSCGEVVNVRAVTHTPSGSGVGIAGGAVVGGLLGNQVGGGTGRTLATIAGAVGGGYAGNVVEKRVRSSTSYVVEVRMENGKTRTFPQTNENWRVGDQVRVVNGHLEGRG